MKPNRVWVVEWKNEKGEWEISLSRIFLKKKLAILERDVLFARDILYKFRVTPYEPVKREKNK